ncbi:NAD(P)H-binding protein [Winogradskyella sp.]|uniref:NAD(P)H-binding protein n=1 Tax=Winogradskyella sp. TaxID=1883156 RepID=UPI0025CBA35D|nr:NAD(P)H-binding protein [Winogradskyella sp.]
MKEKISVIGSGWLGFPLAKYLISEGFIVKGSTTSNDKLALLKKHHIDGYLVHLNETEISGNYADFLNDSEIVIINIPPGLRRHPNKNHTNEIRHLVSAIEDHNIKNVLYVSSTSVFNDETHFPEIDDSTIANTTSRNGKQLIEIEQMLQNNSKFNTIILRFGGLFDEERHPAIFLSGRKNITNPDAPINLIHKEDCIQIITTIIKNKIWNVSINAVHPNHPNKKTYYSAYCKRQNIPLPEFNISEKSKGKIINNSNLVQLLNYTFKQVP